MSDTAPPAGRHGRIDAWGTGALGLYQMALALGLMALLFPRLAGIVADLEDAVAALA